MKHIFTLLALTMALSACAQTNIYKSGGITQTVGVPGYRPGASGNIVAIDTLTGLWYVSRDRYSVNWLPIGDRIQYISGCAAPAYTPGKHQSLVVLNACDSLYRYRDGDWWHLNPGGVSGVAWGAITGTLSDQTDIQDALDLKLEVEVDGSVTNEIELPSQAGNNGKFLKTDGTSPSWETVTAGITGSGASGYLPKFATSSSISDSPLYTDGTGIAIGTTSFDALAQLTGSKTAISAAISPTASTGAYYGMNFDMSTTGMTGTSGWSGVRFNRTGSDVSTGASYYIRLLNNSTEVFAVSKSGEIFHVPPSLSGFASYQYNGQNTSAQYGFFRGTNANTGISFRNAVTDNGNGVGFRFSLTTTAAYTAVSTTTAKVLTVENGQTGGSGFTPDLFNVYANGKVSVKTAIGVGTTSPNASSALDVTSTTGGILFPRMTTVQRDAIATPADGLVIYNTTDAKLQVRAGGAWVNLH